MQKYLSQQNFTILLDTLIKQGTRVVAPRMNAGIPLYEPLTNSGEMVTGQLPRRSSKEAFFPVCEDIMSYEKEGQQVKLTDIDPVPDRHGLVSGISVVLDQSISHSGTDTDRLGEESLR